MTREQRIKILAKEFEVRMIKLQGSATLRTKQAYNNLLTQLNFLIQSLSTNEISILKKRILKSQYDFAKLLRKLTYSYIEGAQNLSYLRYKTELRIILDVGLNEEVFKEALKLYSAKIQSAINKQYISNRIWNINKPFFDNIKREIDKGLLQGLGADDLAKNLKSFVNNPLPVGRGIYRDASKNAERLVRTELKRAYEFQTHNQIQNLPFVKGIKVNTSAAHPEIDMCDELAGNYPASFYFGGWHPNCICYQTTILASKAESKEIIQNGGVTKSLGMPKNYFNYLHKNEKRFAKKPPLFFIENKKLSK